MLRGLVLILALSACVPRAARRGDELALAGDWTEARASYERAMLQRPQSPRLAGKVALADRMLDQQRREDAESARQRAESALASGDYLTTFAELQTARSLDPESEAIQQLSIAAGDQLRGLAEERARAEGWVAAYPLAALALRLDPGEARAVALVTRARTGLVSEIDVRIEARDFEGAASLADLVAISEPAVAEDVASRVDSAWSADLVRTASAAEKRGNTGEAWMLFARAAAMHPTQDAVAARERVGRGIVDAKRLSVAWPSPGTALAADLAVLSRQALGDGIRFSADGPVKLSQVAADWSCDEDVNRHTASKQYVASYRWIENPARRDAVAKAYEVRAEVPGWEARAASGYAAIEELQYQAEQRLADWRVFEDAALRAEETTRATEDWVDEAERALKQAEDDLSQAPFDQDAAPWIAARDEWVDELRSRKSTLDGVAAASREARSHADELGGRAVAAEDQLERSRRDYDGIQEGLAKAAAEVDRADAAVAALPSEIEEPVHDTFAYEALEVVRTCVVKATVSLGPRRSQSPRAFKASRTVRDRHHPAHADYGVAADPLALTEDAKLVEAALAEVSTQLVAAVRAEQEAYYQGLAAEASGAEADEATALQGSLLVLRPSLGDAAWVRERWGLEPEDLLAR